MNRLKTIVGAVAVIVLWTVCAGAAGGGSFGLYATALGLDCDFIDAQPGVLSIYVVVTAPDGVSSARFSAPIPACMTGATWISDTPVFSLTGNSQTGLVVNFGECHNGTAHVLTINILTQGTSGACCYYPVLPHPSDLSGRIETVDCYGTPVYGFGTFSVVNGNESCACGGTIPVEETTWGKVKAFYN